MNSKADRVNQSIINMKACVSYLYREVDKEFTSKKLNNESYILLSKALQKIYNLLNELEFEKPFRNKKLDKIRSLNLSIMPLYEKVDYDIIAMELMRLNSVLGKDKKKIDRNKLNDLKKTINGLPKSFQDKIIKSVKSSEGLSYKTKGDNLGFIFKNYLNAKYNMKKVKCEEVNISDESSELIDSCTSIINSDELDINVRQLYTDLKTCIEKYAKAEVIIKYLGEMDILCDEPEFVMVKKQVINLLAKYKSIYEVCFQKSNLIQAQNNMFFSEKNETKRAR